MKFVVSIENSNTFLHGNLTVEYSPNATNHRIEEVQAENVQVLEGKFSFSRLFKVIVFFQGVDQQFLG